MKKGKNIKALFGVNRNEAILGGGTREKGRGVGLINFDLLTGQLEKAKAKLSCLKTPTKFAPATSPTDPAQNMAALSQMSDNPPLSGLYFKVIMPRRKVARQIVLI